MGVTNFYWFFFIFQKITCIRRKVRQGIEYLLAHAHISRGWVRGGGAFCECEGESGGTRKSASACGLTFDLLRRELLWELHEVRDVEVSVWWGVLVLGHALSLEFLHLVVLRDGFLINLEVVAIQVLDLLFEPDKRLLQTYLQLHIEVIFVALEYGMGDCDDLENDVWRVLVFVFVPWVLEFLSGKVCTQKSWSNCPVGNAPGKCSDPKNKKYLVGCRMRGLTIVCSLFIPFSMKSENLSMPGIIFQCITPKLGKQVSRGSRGQDKR